MFKGIGLAYGIFLILGAFLGWKAGSKVSLVMGLVSGCLVLFSVYLMNTNFNLGAGLLAGISGVLSVIFLLRFVKTQKIMPSGMLLGVSAAVCILFLIQMLSKK